MYNGLAEGTDFAITIATNSEGIVCVTGSSQGVGTNYDYATIRYDSEGNEQWVARYNGEGNGSDQPSSLALDEAGNVFVTGYTFVSGGVSDCLTIKYNSDGSEEWIAKYNGPADEGDNASAITVDQPGNVYITGYSTGTVSYHDYVTIKYDSNGSEEWVARYDGPDNGEDYASAISVDHDGNVYVTGNSSASGTGNDFATIKYDSLGTEQWVARYDGPASSDDYPYAITLDNEGNVYVTGCTSDNSDYYDCTTIKYDNDGVEQWVISYDGPQNEDDEGYAIALDDNGNVYVTGYGTGIGTESDYTTIKYSQTVGIESPDEPVGLYLFPVSPNPSSTMFTISYCIPEATETRIGIYSISGRLVSEVDGVEQNPGLCQVQMECMASGLYFCRLETETESLTESFVVIR